ncbi:decarboxylase family protein [Verticillium alfalfae VaMs.102]|uniref:Decarboxylase family protein n=1 Tax=Verticillium alfalfae (strain VaMs.102 / ATCC MYA-4576 / FGSC 10136) TaxID=526221 RepID=C9SHS2_VERA1|nr:decarboxylase family protein [Verticillium alfalfae VaMs.102]EEY18495.1 decarboxylase family protein [Verticillium alfalfae VaMs.102]
METDLLSSEILPETFGPTVTHEHAAVAATDENLVPRRTILCVYCGASDGNKPVHMKAARELARLMAANDMHLVYGGGTVGLMGEVAKTLVSLSGPGAVHGIIPEALVKYERNDQIHDASPGLRVPDESVYGRTTIVKDMHTRKRMMAHEVFNGGPGSGFIALAGGYGTIEEILETTTWVQLGIHSRGVCLLNIDGFYDGILSWIEHAAAEGFVKGDNARIVATATTAAEAIAALASYQVPSTTFKLKWDMA